MKMMKLKFSENATKFFDEIFVFNLLSKGAFFNYVDKRKWVGNPKMSTKWLVDGKKAEILST